MTRHTRNLAAFFLAVLALGAAWAGVRRASNAAATRVGAPSDPGVRPTGVPRGGELVVSIRTEPVTFNRFVKGDSSTDLVSNLLNAKLVRINRATQEVEPWLAERWTRSDDGLRYTLKLREGVVFSDGHPFTADDVLFSFAAAADEAGGSVLAGALHAGGGTPEFTAPDPLTVVMTLSEPFAPGVRILDNVPILPRHRLQPALASATLASVWGLDTPPGDLAGLGPFVLAEYLPGQRLIFTRNPSYFVRDADGAALPYLDRLVVRVIPDQDAELLALEAGDIDMTTSEVRPEDYAPLKRAADAGKITLLDLGVGYDADAMWFNLRPGAFDGDPRASWIQRDELRQAITMAIDRKVFADTVYLGAGVPVYGPITPANRLWYAAEAPQPRYDPAAAKALIESIAGGQPVRFSLLVPKGRTAIERAGAVIRDELKKIGVTVDVVALDGAALVQRVAGPSPRFDAAYFSLYASDTDPAINPDFWLSSGTAHVWNMMQTTPATSWERQIDELFAKQAASSDEGERHRLFADIQKIFAAHQPVLYFVAPRVFVASSSRVAHVEPGLTRPQLLWAPDRVAVSPARAARPER
ncbi:MAG: ABC transporter substrate-binding protein [Acidobacteria bacterium]|nr:ABC transporter substrate-binding protein [Acidobacteriota bacterium]